MSIIGIGTDIVEQMRISALLERFGQKFVDRILSIEEQKSFERSSNPVSYLAKRFAAKEAVAKAFGTGIGQAFAFNEISVTNLPSGQPTVSFIGRSKEFVDNRNVKEVMISLSDEKAFALAFVVITKN